MRENPPVWHAIHAHAALEWLGTPEEGLSSQMASRRLQLEGPNQLPSPAQPGAWHRLLSQFHDLLIYVLLVSGVFTMTLGHWVDAGVILGVVIINALIGFFQEGRAQRAIDTIRELISLRTLVLRNGTIHGIDAHQLVTGDIVHLEAGDLVPADLRLLKASGLRMDESSLTGESLPVGKQTQPLPIETALADRLNMAYAGSLVLAGQGDGLVIATGAATELGRINRLLTSIEPPTTPLLYQIRKLTEWLTLSILIMAGLTFIFGAVLYHQKVLDMFLSAVAFAVAAIPEGLPAIITITLAIGVRHMAERHVIIRRLSAVESLGAVNVICTDKTGTLTRNEMTAVSLVTADAHYAVEAHGYAPTGDITPLKDEENTANPGDLADLLRTGALCSDGTIERQHHQWTAVGDPIDAALVVAAKKLGLAPPALSSQWPRLDTIPFETGLQLMATLHVDDKARRFIALKGAPERVLARCDTQRVNGTNQPLDNTYWQHQIESMADAGQRVLAIATRSASPLADSLSHAALDHGFCLLGLVGFIDPLREEAFKAVSQALQAGIAVKMMTGDHLRTAMAIASSLGIKSPGTPLTGQDIVSMDKADLASKAKNTAVFARVTPEHKLLLIEALQQTGHVIAMTGDGINDTPALKQADVGVAMGLKGTRAAMEAAEMVITDDNFASIVAGIEEGRTAYDNIRKALLFILPTNGAEAMVIMVAVITNSLLPVSPVQILWINMITAITLSLVLAFERTEPDVMKRPPHPAREPLISGFLFRRILMVSIILLAVVDLSFYVSLKQGMDLAVARTSAVNMLVLGEIAYLLSTRHIHASPLNRNSLTENPWILPAVALTILFQILFTYAPFMQDLFTTASLPWTSWPPMILLAALIYWLLEFEKKLII